jgi:hypothetical protein
MGFALVKLIDNCVNVFPFVNSVANNKTYCFKCCKSVFLPV